MAHNKSNSSAEYDQTPLLYVADELLVLLFVIVFFLTSIILSTGSSIIFEEISVLSISASF